MVEMILAILLVMVVLAGLGWLMMGSLSWARNRGQVQSSVGNAMQELERLVSKPSIEFTVEAETKLRKDDDQGGD